jgi:hypothetical protein
MDDVIDLAAQRYPGQAFVGFMATHDEYASAALPEIERMFERHGWHFVSGIPDSLERRRADGVRVDGSPHDNHWSPDGHAVVARLLAQQLRARGLIPPTVVDAQPPNGSLRQRSRSGPSGRTVP